MNDKLTDFLNHQSPKHSKLYTFSKDSNSRYTHCNENLARIAGADSPQQMLGKTDHDFIWRKQADLFQRGDRIAMRGEPFINVQEPLQQSNITLDILISKYPLKNKYGDSIGIAAHFIDITGYCLIKKNDHYNQLTGRYHLGPKFHNEYLTKSEIIIIRHLLKGSTAKSIAKTLLLSPRTVETHLINIKYKLQVHSKSEIIPALIQNGLTKILHLLSPE